jgi:membrane protein DedA with SNARE-associated domain
MLLTGYLTGRRSGMFIARKLHQEKRAERAKQIFSKHGGVILTTSLTSNVTRFWISYVAGMKKVNFGKFCFYSSVASVTWVAVWSTAGYVVGGERYNLEKMIVRLGVFSWVLLLVALGTIFWSSRKEYEDTGN